MEERLNQVQAENEKLRIDKEKAEQLTQTEKQRANNYQQQLKVIVKSLYQWQKINYYQQLEQEQKAQIEQSLKPPSSFKK